MRILHIISSGGMYGAEAVILNLSRALREMGHTSVLGVFSNSANPNLQLHEAAARDEVESHLIPCNKQIDRTVPGCIRELVKSTGADVVHAHGYKADIYTYLALRGTKTALVSTCHTWYDNDLAVTLYGKADRLVLRRYAGVVAVSDEVKERLLTAGVRPERVHMVRNGIDLRPFDGARPGLREELGVGDALLVGLVGRLSVEKGVDIFLRAAERVLTEVPSARFVVVGEGQDREKLEALIDGLGIRKSATMAGQRNDMPAVYASLDVMVSASRQEGLPMAILEGMASRRPLIASTVGAVPTVVMDGRSGVLVPPEDVELLATEIVALLHDPTLRERLGASARELIEEEYSAGRMTADYLRVYDEAIAIGRSK